MAFDMGGDSPQKHGTARKKYVDSPLLRLVIKYLRWGLAEFAPTNVGSPKIGRVSPFGGTYCSPSWEAPAIKRIAVRRKFVAV